MLPASLGWGLPRSGQEFGSDVVFPVGAVAAAVELALASLRQQLACLDRLVVAYSGGVDSALVAALAMEQRGEAALAITGVSPALAPHLRAEAAEQARWLRIPHREIATAELTDPAYASNPEQA